MLPNKAQTNERENVLKTTLQSHREGAFWFWPGSTLKTTMESKKSKIIY